MKYNKGYKGKGKVHSGSLNKNVFQCCCAKDKQVQKVKKDAPKG